MEILQFTGAVFLGLWSLYYIIRKFRPKNKSIPDQSCGRDCGC